MVKGSCWKRVGTSGPIFLSVANRAVGFHSTRNETFAGAEAGSKSNSIAVMRLWLSRYLQLNRNISTSEMTKAPVIATGARCSDTESIVGTHQANRQKDIAGLKCSCRPRRQP